MIMREFLRRLNLAVSKNYMPDKSCIPYADKILEHELSILNSPPAVIKYGMQCKGFEGHVFSNPNHNYEDVKKKAYKVAPSQVGFMQKAEELRKEISPSYEPIPWHLDIITGYVYSLVWHTNVPVGKIDGVDAKTPSDFSRMYYVLTLAKAYRLTKDVKYRKEAMAQLLDWVAVNPAYYGPAWRNGMNVSIRITNVICAFSMLELDYDNKQDKKFIEILYELILLHTKFIAMTAEFAKQHNHLVAEVCALTLTTALYSDYNTTDDTALYNASLEKMAWYVVNREIIYQIADDGMDFENTTSYHAYVLEMFTYPIFHALRVRGCNNANDFVSYATKNKLISQESFDKLKKAAEALSNITQPDGNIPYICDNDAGRFIEWEANDKHNADTRSIACSVAVLLNDSSIVPASARDVDFIPASAFFDDAKPITSTFKQQSKFYEEAGLFVFADKDFFSVFRSGCRERDRQRLIGHMHNDQLSFTLCAKGKPFIIDTGTYTYTGDKVWRKKLKSIFAHNSVAIDDIETDKLNVEYSFAGASKKNLPYLVDYQVTENSATCTAEHTAYIKLPDKVTVTRTLTYNGNSFTGYDVISRNGIAPKDGEITERFIVNSDAKVELKDNKAIVELDGEFIEISTENGYIRTEVSYHSINYGMKKDTTAVVIVLPRNIESNKFTIKW